jgi:type IV pilus assembly protein PilB
MTTYKRINKKFIGDLLIERGVISRLQLEEAIVYQKEKGGLLGEVLLQLGYASEEDIAQALTSQYGFPYLPLSNYEIEQDVVSAVSCELCNKFCLIPIDKIGASLTLAMANPLNTEAIEEVEAITHCSVQTFVSTATDIRDAIKKHYI